MLKIFYFASLREQLGAEQHAFVLPTSVKNVGELIEFLKGENSDFKEVFDSAPKILVAVNQVVVSRNFELTENDEIAFFPPMTGG
jgi:molybdopterin synthase sulfur carrier subunit